MVKMEEKIVNRFHLKTDPRVVKKIVLSVVATCVILAVVIVVCCLFIPGTTSKPHPTNTKNVANNDVANNDVANSNNISVVNAPSVETNTSGNTSGTTHTNTTTGSETHQLIINGVVQPA